MSIMDEEEMHLLDELHEYLSSDDSLWSVSSNHMSLIGKFLHAEGLSPSIRLNVLGLLQLAVLQFDTILMLKHDPACHFMKFAENFDKHDKDTQKELLRVVSNMCSTKSGVNWLLSIVDIHEGVLEQPNTAIITKLTVTSLLSDDAVLAEIGANLVLHFASYQLSYYADSAVEISFAVLECLGKSSLPEVFAYYLYAALYGFMLMTQEVSGILQLLGTDLQQHAKLSPRIDKLHKKIAEKLRMP